VSTGIQFPQKNVGRTNLEMCRHATYRRGAQNVVCRQGPPVPTIFRGKRFKEMNNFKENE
jgi:hypothetical protein